MPAARRSRFCFGVGLTRQHLSGTRNLRKYSYRRGPAHGDRETQVVYVTWITHLFRKDSVRDASGEGSPAARGSRKTRSVCVIEITKRPQPRAAPTLGLATGRAAATGIRKNEPSLVTGITKEPRLDSLSMSDSIGAAFRRGGVCPIALLCDPGHQTHSVEIVMSMTHGSELVSSNCRGFVFLHARLSCRWILISHGNGRRKNRVERRIYLVTPLKSS